MRNFFATTLGQILAIIAASSAATFPLFIALVYVPWGPPNPPWPWQTAYRIVGLVQTLQAMPEGERASFLAVKEHGMSARFVQTPPACSSLTMDAHDLKAVLKSEFPDISGISVCTSGAQGQHETVQVLVPFGAQTLDIRSDKAGRPPSRMSFPVWGSLVFMFVGMAVTCTWAVRRIVRPLQHLSEKAEVFGREVVVTHIDEVGPLEMRRVAKAFNRMQERITRLLENRTRMLAAISHDLRTPLTRMRLQLDLDETYAGREKLLRDIGLMQAMITAVLDFLSSGFDHEKREWLDVEALLTTLCDEYEEAGAAIRYEGSESLRLYCQPGALQRALVNLIENAIHYGNHVTVRASRNRGEIMIEVIDDGPGIPADRIRDVMEPFVRLDSSRAERPGSVGLGLSIVKEIVQAHGGTLVLANRNPTGLVARIQFGSPGLADDLRDPASN
ncbi:ATP-binding protein [Burkholderia sp. JPY481]